MGIILFIVLVCVVECVDIKIKFIFNWVENIFGFSCKGQFWNEGVSFINYMCNSNIYLYCLMFCSVGVQLYIFFYWQV